MGEAILGRQIVSEADDQSLSTAYGLYRGDHLYPIAKLPALRALKGEFVVVDDLELHQPDGKIMCSVNTFQDITQRKVVEEVLAGYNRALAGTAIHLTSIIFDLA